MKTYYLYLKTHNQTGLKYLGFTSSKDPSKYTGSGIYWLNHINKHGYDVKTEILIESTSLNEIKITGLYFSDLWDIVNNNDFANLKVESGDGGWCLTKESIDKRNKTKIEKYGSVFPNSKSKEFVEKCIAGRIRNNTLNVQTPETVAKSLATKKKNGTLNVQTPESVAKGIETKKKNGTYGKTNITPESIAKQLETKRKNGTLKRTIESLEKQKQTVKNRPKHTCPHCNKTFSYLKIFIKSHGENCKLKPTQ